MEDGKEDAVGRKGSMIVAEKKKNPKGCFTDKVTVTKT